MITLRKSNNRESFCLPNNQKIHPLGEKPQLIKNKNKNFFDCINEHDCQEEDEDIHSIYGNTNKNYTDKNNKNKKRYLLNYCCCFFNKK